MPPVFEPLIRHDERILHALLERRVPWLNRAMRRVTRLGDAVTVVSLTAGGLCGPQSLQQAARTAAFALIASHAVVQLIKRTVSRARPRLPVGIESLIHAPDRFSFPSGHAAAALSIALAFAPLLIAPVAIALIVLALIVGVSRCYLGVHYPGDVIAGWLLAVAAVFGGQLIL